MNNEFLIGRIGGKEIVKESITTFFQKTKELDWTTNSIYKAATYAEIKPTFSNYKTGSGDTILSKYDLKSVEGCFVDTSKLNSYLDFIADEDERNIKVIDKIATNREKIYSLTSNNPSTGMVKQDLINHLKCNWKRTILNNEELSKLLEPYKGWISQTVKDS